MDVITLFLRGIVENLKTRYGKIFALLVVVALGGIYTIDAALAQVVCDPLGVCVDYIQDGTRGIFTAVRNVLIFVAGILGFTSPAKPKE